MKSEDGQLLVAELQRSLFVGLPFDEGDGAVIRQIIRVVEERENERSKLFRFLMDVEDQLDGCKDWGAVRVCAEDTRGGIKRWREVLHKQNPTGQAADHKNGG